MKCKIVAQVIYDYDAQTDEELTIREGQILLITDDSDKDWWEALEKPKDTFDEVRKGLVPLTYVEEAPPIGVATALYDYTPQSAEEIPLREGSLVRIYEKVDSDWWFVKIDNDVGLVPATYVEEQAANPKPPQEDVNRASEASNPEHQKNMLMNALNGFGFEARKSDIKPTGIIYGPDDVTYYTVTDLDKKKKKNSVKGLLGVCQKEKIIYFLDLQTKEINYKIGVSTVKKVKDKKTKLILELDGDAKEYEGEKSDIQALVVHIETAMKTKGAANPVVTAPVASPVASPMVVAPPVVTKGPVAQEPPKKEPDMAIALYDYQSTGPDELTIVENDPLIVLDPSDPDWWLVKFVNKPGQGLVPKTYVEIKKRDQSPARPGPSPAKQKAQSVQTPENAAIAEKQYREIEMKRLREEQEEERIRKQMEERERQQKAEQMRQEQQRRDEEKLENDRREFERREAEKRELAEKEAARAAERREAQRMKVPLTAKVAVSPALPDRPSQPVFPERPQPVIPERTVSSGERPNLATRPTAPTSRPKTETKLEAPKQMGPDPAKVRNWTDKTGTFTVQAAYTGLVDGKVTLLKLNGATVHVPLEKLNEDSIRFVQSQPGNENINVGNKQNIPMPPTLAKRPSVANQKDDETRYTYNDFNWKEWLVKAGVASSDAANYAIQFVEQRMDLSILRDVDRDALRAMKITEGDIIRIRKAANLPAMTSAVKLKAETNEKMAEVRNLEMLGRKITEKSTNKQILDDEALARRLQEEENRMSKDSRVSNNFNPNVNILQSSTNNARFPSTVTSNTASVRGSLANNDPWASQNPNDLRPSANQKWKEQQDETQKTLEVAKQAIQKANEQAKKAAQLEEEARAKQAEVALIQAQETAQKALMMQKMAEQKLMAAQTAAVLPQFQSPPVPKPLAAPLIPVPGAGFSMPLSAPMGATPAMNSIVAPMANLAMNPTSMQTVAPIGNMPNPQLMNNMQNNPMMNNMQNSVQNLNAGFNPGMGMVNPTPSLVTNIGVQRPNWNNTAPDKPFGNGIPNDPYQAFRESQPNGPSVFNSLTPNMTGSSSARTSTISNAGMMNQIRPLQNTNTGNYAPSNNMTQIPSGFNQPSSQLQSNMMQNRMQPMQNMQTLPNQMGQMQSMQPQNNQMNYGAQNQMGMQSGMTLAGNIGLNNMNTMNNMNQGMGLNQNFGMNMMNNQMKPGMNQPMGMNTQMPQQMSMGLNPQMNQMNPNFQGMNQMQNQMGGMNQGFNNQNQSYYR